MELNDDHWLCTKCFKNEFSEFEAAQSDEVDEMEYSSDMKQVRREFAIDKLNEVFQMFQLEPVIP